MKFQLFFLLVIQVYLLFGLETRGNGKENLVDLGSVEGKTYFYNKEDRNWTASRAYCQEQGMELATVDSAAQVEFLRLQYNSTTFVAWYWIAARDAQLPRALSWDATDEQVNDIEGIEWEILLDDYKVCGAYASSSQKKFYMLECSYLTYVLCQISTNN
ncbi:unnamed protein product [Orchesella dallaii]|uniref:C-type lectin domain-containing protein n=1 Tax=Orchesella dallaii TaxID=48710 RepID=A0ABP1QJ95_9HEXA